ncbi:DNA-binding GntR family transcriptional regulator [Mycobacterium frederiksbergense]|uniref:DNA-binding GntR family transcriptional regulator n=1 Tax=Mycolicibacterium frederiksbergense TaxID=117567 RepID=A0ABT6L8P8_9MYCO|nr:GntR family transcriptional regulator [Mycolicibacterium frederiksbergense]MDH6198602.1 DNA-binding GntR family transcriptional regulator [Mycolicibacterium frederiksbergense]
MAVGLGRLRAAMTSLKKIEAPSRIADEIYDQLLEAITQGRIAPDDRLVQERLAAELGISRTPLREALLRLEQEGMLVRAGRAGFELRQITEAEVQQIYGARQAIEGYAARFLADHGRPEDFREIEKQIDAEERRDLVSVADYYHSSRRVHRQFTAHTHNPYLLEMFDSMWNRAVSFHIYATTMQMDALAESVREHRALLEGIRSSDGAQASELMCQHIAEGLQLQLEAMKGAHS